MAISLSACYTLTPVDPAEVAPPTSVVVHVASRSSSDGSGGEETEVIEGRLTRVGPETLGLSVGRFVGPTGAPGGLRAGQVQIEQDIDLSRVVRMEEKRLSAVRTGGLIAAISAGTVLFARFLWRAAGGFMGDGPGSDPLFGPSIP